MIPTTLTEAEALVLNAVSDDAENLEQLQRQLSFEPLGGASGDLRSCAWRDSDRGLPLAEIADAVRSLVERGLLVARFDPAEPGSIDDLSYVWRGWFEPTAEGRSALASSAP